MIPSVVNTPAPPAVQDTAAQEEDAALKKVSEDIATGMALNMLQGPIMKFSSTPMEALTEGEDEEPFFQPPPIPFDG